MQEAGISLSLQRRVCEALLSAHVAEIREAHGAGLLRFAQFGDREAIGESARMPADRFLLAAFVADAVGSCSGKWTPAISWLVVHARLAGVRAGATPSAAAASPESTHALKARLPRSRAPFVRLHQARPVLTVPLLHTAALLVHCPHSRVQPPLNLHPASRKTARFKLANAHAPPQAHSRKARPRGLAIEPNASSHKTEFVSLAFDSDYARAISSLLGSSQCPQSFHSESPTLHLAFDSDYAHAISSMLDSSQSSQSLHSDDSFARLPSVPPVKSSNTSIGHL
ncbi:hypothetical protein B0H15DRAFT_982785 [Mycena belliarum]|uniref:Uncharacterized protein n=1 Tax=Mycena belliarum TaxID=1033014 RepID=A0AAD6U2N1_9AGAR|nr:hypothetical protein B0H15DRAFT_982785 [Mycena belliae]